MQELQINYYCQNDDICITTKVSVKSEIYFFAVCETIHHQKTIQEDQANCRHEPVAVCVANSADNSKCPTIPSTKCVITQVNTTKNMPQTEVSIFYI